MRGDREAQVTQAFVELASSLANGDDVVDLLSRLTVDCVELLDVASAGLLLADPLGVLHVMAASSEGTRQLEVLQLQRQAKGVLAQRGGLEMAEAFSVLRKYSPDHNLRLTDAAQAVVSRTLPAQLLIEHAQSGG